MAPPRRRGGALLLASGLLRALPLPPPAAAAGAAPDRIYWTNYYSNTIQRANLADGSGVEDVLGGAGVLHPWGLVVDTARCWMYWADVGSKAIRRARLDGSGAQDFVRVGEAPAYALWHSAEEDMLYWTQRDARVKRTSLAGEGSEVEELLNSNSGIYFMRQGIAVDTATHPARVYVADNSDWAIRKQDWGTTDDGYWTEDADIIFSPAGMAIDKEGRMLYWADGGFDDVRRASLDEDGVSKVEIVAKGFGQPRGLTLDHLERRLYFTGRGVSPGSHHIYQMDLEGNPGWSIFLPGTPQPSALAIVRAGAAEAAGCSLSPAGR